MFWKIIKYYVNFDVNENFAMLNSQDKNCLISVSENLHINNKPNKNDFNKILNNV